MLSLMQHKETDKVIGRAIAAFRDAKGLSQAELAGKLGDAIDKRVDPTTVTRMEKGTRPVTASELVALSSLLGVEIHQFTQAPEDSEVLARIFEIRDQLLHNLWKRENLHVNYAVIQSQLSRYLEEVGIETWGKVMTDDQADVITGLLADPPVLPADYMQPLVHPSEVARAFRELGPDWNRVGLSSQTDDPAS